MGRGSRHSLAEDNYFGSTKYEAQRLLSEDEMLEDVLNVGEQKVQKGAYVTLAILTLVNLLNYADRMIPSATKSLYQKEFDITDMQSSIPASTFIVVYMIFSPIFAALADRGVSRKFLLIAGVVWWSLSTGAVYFSHHFWEFTIYRSLVAVGEACYATIAPALLSDLYPPLKRNKAMMVFFVATPIGAALGFVLGGQIGHYFGWRYAFLICGAPGILIAFSLLLATDPGRNIYEKREDRDKLVPWSVALKSLLNNRTYLVTLGGLTCLTWAIGAIADWAPEFFVRNTSVSVDQAGLVVGAMAVIGGLGGTIAGSLLGDVFKRRVTNSYMLVSAVGALTSSVVFVLMFFFAWKKTNVFLVFATLLVAQFLGWWYTGPINAILANVVSSHIRARSFATTIIVMHTLGDGVSPLLVGLISDHVGSDKAEGLLIALLTVPTFIFIAGVVWMSYWYLAAKRGLIFEPEEPVDLPE
ncbi:major facilitator superfamily protein [Planoprotostelium fungivorum]|uniref:Major facilitator superfamily protein n=1 Tax=Planoprotostelium fungivorum TaxID=1890364 RepID=A0A2P6NB09_9EUKA|nr:major facilitator superfamily protein [Planoprotostelium fungivorum]